MNFDGVKERIAIGPLNDREPPWYGPIALDMTPSQW